MPDTVDRLLEPAVLGACAPYCRVADMAHPSDDGPRALLGLHLGHRCADVVEVIEHDETFVLTPHETMRGIRVKDGGLVLRPVGWVQAACGIEFALACVAAAAMAGAGGAWRLLVPVAIACAVNAVQRARVAVIATSSEVTVRNRWSTRRIPLPDILEVTTEVKLWSFRQPAYVFTRTAIAGRRWEVGVLAVRPGSTLECDALVSAAPVNEIANDATPAAMKAEALGRWVEVHQSLRSAP